MINHSEELSGQEHHESPAELIERARRRETLAVIVVILSSATIIGMLGAML